MSERNHEKLPSLLDSLKSAFEKCSLNAEPSLLKTARINAFEKFLDQGLPTVKDEAYRYVSFSALEQEIKAEPCTEQKSLVNKRAQLQVHLNNGKLDRKKSILNESLVVVDSIENAQKTYKALLDSKFKSYSDNEKASLDPFVLCNHALFEEGVFIYIPSETPNLDIDITLESSDLDKMQFPKIMLFAGKSSKANINVVYQDAKRCALFAPHIEIHLDQDSHVNVYDVAYNLRAASLINYHCCLKKNAQFYLWQLASCSHMTRHNLEVVLQEEGAHADLKGLSLLQEKNQAHVFVTMKHESPNATSSQHFKTVLFDKSKHSFEGKILVDSIAQQTQSYQLCNQLILGERAKAFCKPNLEIFADDVKASHGATLSKINPEDLFYLQARGIAKPKAKELLARGFCEEILKGFSNICWEGTLTSFLNRGFSKADNTPKAAAK